MTTFKPLSGDPSGMVYAWGLCQHTAKYGETYDMKSSEAVLEDLFGYFEASWTEGKPQMLNLTRHLDVFSGLVRHSEIIFRYLGDVEKDPTPKLLNLDAGGGTITDKEITAAVRKIKETAAEYFLSVSGMIPLYIQDEGERRVAVQTYIDGMTSGESVPEARVQALLSLFNVCEPLNLCLFEILVAICEFSSKGGVFHSVAPYCKTMEEWIAGWSIPASESRRIYRVLATETRPASEGRLGYLHKFLQSYQFESDEAIATDSSVSLLLEAYLYEIINSPTILFFTQIGTLRPFTLLRTQSKNVSFYASLVKLLESGTLSQFDAFYKEHKSHFEALSLRHAQIRDKFVLLSILDLSQCKKRSIADYADKLNLTAPETEKYLIQAISANLLNPKISHIDQSVYIAYAKCRNVTKQEWVVIKQKLGQLIDIVDATIGRRETAYAQPQ